MPEEWIIQVKDREYGPIDLQGLRQWKEEGRVLPSNPARPVESDVWLDASQIPGLFDSPTPLEGTQLEEPAPSRSLRNILGQTCRIYANGFFQFLPLTLLVVVPSICAQVTGSVLESSAANADLRGLFAGSFAFGMLLLSLALWPVYVAGVQLLTTEIYAGRRPGFFPIISQAVRFWPRVALLCIFVYGSYVFWTILPVVVILMIAANGRSLGAFFIALLPVAFQVWIIGRLFINFMFWQQFAVLAGTDAAQSLRGSKALARSRQDSPWYKRPLWRGVFISSLWFAFVLALNFPLIWSALRDYFHELTVSQDPGEVMQALAAHSKAHGSNVLSFTAGVVQAVVRPLLGIAFVVLYLDARSFSSGKARDE
jgi:hypothetical protein